MAEKSKNLLRNIRRPVEALNELDPALKFKIEESYKTIRTNLVFSIMKKGCKRVVFTSARPDEGKTSTAINLAVALASADYRVLLIDTDLRKPKLHQYFGIRVTPGLTNFLGSMVDKTHPLTLSSVVQRTGYSNLYLMPAGSCPANPAELLASELMSALLNQIGDQFDYIFMDTPPINVVSDALPLIKQSDGVVGVIRANSSTYPEVDKMVQAIRFIEGTILGFVLTAAEETSNTKGYSYDYYSYSPGKGRARKPGTAFNHVRQASPGNASVEPTEALPPTETASQDIDESVGNAMGQIDFNLYKDAGSQTEDGPDEK